jgi:phosphoserine phosphatase
MTGPPGAAVFDLDGTLVDTMRTMPQAYADTVRELGGPALTSAEVVAAGHVGPAPVLLRTSCAGRSRTPTWAPTSATPTPPRRPPGRSTGCPQCSTR